MPDAVQLQVLPLRSPTLPPATTTNAVLLDADGLWVVDPAPIAEDARRQLARHLEPLARDGRLAGILLSHHHRDHVGAASWLAEHLGLPIAAHARTASLAETVGIRDLHVARTLSEGETLGGDWEVLETPGHASDHLVLVDRRTGCAVVGDMVATVGTIVVDPPDGHMGTYLASLDRLARLNLQRIVPAHGDPIDTPSARFRGYLAHRAMREARVLDAIGEAPAPLRDVTARAWPDLDPRLLPLAERACLAHLEHLLERGLAEAHPPLDSGRDTTPAARPCLARGTTWARPRR
jgi:ribonuclease/clavin/mitogillin